MKILMLTLTLAILSLGTFTAQPAYAHCGVCEASEKSHKMKPCTKCTDAGKTCKCAMKKGKHDHMKKNKPCKVCEQNDKRFELEKDMTKGWQDRNEKGTYHVLKTKPMTSPYND